MSAPGLSGKSHGEKSSASGGKKYQAVNINSVYSGKSLVGQKSAAPRHGALQSLGKATVVARRMPPPANLPSLKSESAGQDLAVNIVPSGVAGWGTQSTTSQEHPDANLNADMANKKPADGISLRPAGGNVASTGAKGAAPVSGSGPPNTANATKTATSGAQANTTTSGRPTWSARIGTGSTLVGTQSAQEPESPVETKFGTAAPSLRPQRSGAWKPGPGAKHESESPPARNGRDRSPSVSPAPDRPLSHPNLHAASQDQPPYGGYRQGGYPPPAGAPPPPYPDAHAYPYYPPTLYPPPPPPNGSRGMVGGPMYPHHMQPYDYRYGGHTNTGAGGPAPQPPMVQGRYGHAVSPQQPPVHGKQGEGNDRRSVQHPQMPPPDQFRGGPPPMMRNDAPVPYGGMRGPQPMQERNYFPRDGRGDNWAPPAAYYSRELEPRYRDNTVWSDDEGDGRDDRRYGRNDAKRNATDKQQSWSDTEERYEEGDWSRYDGPRDAPMGAGRQVPPHIRSGYAQGPPPPNMRHGQQYPDQHVGMMMGRGGRYGPPPPMPMQQRHIYGPYMPPYDQRHAGQMFPGNYGPQPPQYNRTRMPQDIEAEEEEEMARQQQQQYARDAAMERSKQKRRQQSTGQGNTALEHPGFGDNRRVGNADVGDSEDFDESEADRSSSRESYGMKPGSRRPPNVPPRFSKQGDNRAMGQHNFGYSQSTGSGGPMPHQYKGTHAPVGQGGDGNYEKRSPRQTCTEPFTGDYDSGKRYEKPHYAGENRGYGDDDREGKTTIKGGTRANHIEAPISNDDRDKSVQRPESKESLGSSDRSSNVIEKNESANYNRVWPKENIAAVKEETEKSLVKKKGDEEDTEEDQRLETLSKPIVVVKRTAPATSTEKPKDQPTPTTNVTKSTASESKKSPTQSTVGTTKEDAKSVAASNQQKQQTTQPTSHQPTPDKDDLANKNVWEQRKEQFENKQEPSTVKEAQRKDDQRENTISDKTYDDQNKYEDWSSYGRGRGSNRGRVRREFVSSRRLHGHSLGSSGSAIKRGGHRSYWDTGSSTDRRRGGTGYDQLEKPRKTEEKQDHGKVEESKEFATGESEDVKVAQEKAMVEEKSSEWKEDAETTNKEHDYQGQQSNRGGRSSRGRGVRGARRGSGTHGTDHEWNNRTYDGTGAVYSRSRGGSQGYGNRGYNQGGYGTYDEYDNYYDPYRHYNRDHNERKYGSVAPRFQDHTRSGRYETSGGGHQQGTRRGTGGTRNRDGGQSRAIGSKKENQSEGNDEWETASESSDVAERHKQEGESYENKKPPSSGPKSFSSQRRAPDRRRGGFGNGTIEGRNDTHRRNYESNKMESSNTTSSTNNFGKTSSANFGSSDGQSSSVNQNAFSGPKNAIVASHQASSNKAEAKSSEYSAWNTNRRSTKKDEKPASKPGALATVDISNIAGVVVIDDQPDISIAMENQDGFQEVVSKKRSKKDAQLIDEKDRKSQSPSSHGRKQTQSGGPNTKSDKIGRRSNGNDTPASISNNASARSSAGDSIGVFVAPTTPSPWDRNLTHRMSSNVEHQYRGRGGNESNMSAVGGGSLDVSDTLHSALSKTGVEIWGTPDPVPFAGATDATNNKCVARPTKVMVSEASTRPKSVEFIADSLNKGIDETTGMKLDFTFDASLGPFRDSKQNVMVDQGMNRHNVDLDENHGVNSRSADQLSEKIASVKKVWDGVAAIVECDDGTGQQATAGSYFVGATDEETDAIVSSAASLVSAAVLQSVQDDQSPTGHHPSGYDGESMEKPDLGVAIQIIPSTMGSSSKMDGPNVAKVRPQQMLVEQPAPLSHIVMDEFGNSLIGGGYASNSPTPLFAFPGMNNVASLFSAQFSTKGDFNPGTSQQPLSNFAAYSATATASNRSTFGQQAAFVQPPPMAATQLDMLGNQQRSNIFGAADQNLLFGAPPTNFMSQTVRAPSAMLPTQQGLLPKPSSVNIYGNVQGSFLLQDVSLFSHPPPVSSILTQQPPLAATGMVPARATPVTTVPQQAAAPGSFYFTQPPPPVPISMAQPPPIGATSVLQAPNLPLPPMPGGKISNFTSVPPYGWSGNVVNTQQKTLAPAPVVPVGNKGFNRTIGPPITQKMNVPPPSGIMGASAVNQLFGSSAVGQPQPLSVVTNMATLSSTNLSGGNNCGRRTGVAGGISYVAKGPSSNTDQTKRDGDLLQQMDKFINSTGDDDSNTIVLGNVDETRPETSETFQQVN